MLLAVLVVIFAIALFMGFIGNLTGIGGGAVILLVLIYGFGFTPIDAAELSLLTIAFSSLTGFVRDMGYKLVDVKLFSLMAVIAVVGAIGGTIMANYIPSKTFKGIFAVILVSLGAFSVYASRRQTRAGKERYDTSSAYSTDTGVMSLVAGVVSGFIGIGIGGIMGTYLTAIKRSQPKKAIATIVAATLPITVAGMTMHFYYAGFVDIIYAPSLVIGAFLGGLLGSWIIRKAPQISLRFLQGYVIIAFGVISVILYFLSTSQVS